MTLAHTVGKVGNSMVVNVVVHLLQAQRIIEHIEATVAPIRTENIHISLPQIAAIPAATGAHTRLLQAPVDPSSLPASRYTTSAHRQSPLNPIHPPQNAPVLP